MATFPAICGGQQLSGVGRRLKKDKKVLKSFCSKITKNMGVKTWEHLTEFLSNMFWKLRGLELTIRMNGME